MRKRNYKQESARRKELETADPSKAEQRRAAALKSYYKRKKENPEGYRANVIRGQEKRNEAARKYRATEKGKDTNRDYYLQYNYGISLERYSEMFAEQNGLCYICGRPEQRTSKSGKIMALDVDHNHRTGEIRKLLCHACNVSVGFLDENPNRMRKLAEYVESFQHVLDRQG